MSAIVDYIGTEAKRCFEDIKSGQCFTNFTQMSGKKQLEIIGKVALVAFLSGLFASIICCGIVGAIVGLAAGFAAFAYLTNNNQHDMEGIARDVPALVREHINAHRD